ncbi:MAG: hypothetical protein B7X00_00560 [Legionella sp. 21-45-4]|nr:MAG: hypothetical protein B7X00_00560 [Legionella sp. 21-45-4]
MDNGTHGWLIHKRQVGETGLWLTLFSREQGLLRARLRGRSLAKKNAFFQVFTPLWWHLDEREYGIYVRDMDVSAMSLALEGSNLLAGLYLNELLAHLLALNQIEEQVFDAYEQALYALVGCRESTTLERILRRFEWELLLACGVLVSFTHASDSQLPLNAALYYQFSPTEGFRGASSGYLGRDILAIADLKFEESSVLRTAKRVMPHRSESPSSLSHSCVSV